MWKSSLRKQSQDINRQLTKDTQPDAYSINISGRNTPDKRCMSAQKQQRNSSSIHQNHQLDLLRVEEILRGREPDSQFRESIRMNTSDKERTFNDHFKNVQVPNQKYFRHLQGNCRCGKCSCNRCKCTVRELQSDYKKHNRTLYQADFQPKIVEVPQPFVLDKDNYRQDAKIDMITTQRVDFIPKKSMDPKKECGYLDRNTLQCGNQALDHNTLYKNNFNIKKITPNVLFTHEPIEYMRVPHDKIKQKLSTEKQYMYRKPRDSLLPSQLTEEGKSFTFINFAHDRQKNLKPPIHMDDRMSMATTTRDFFKGTQPEKTMSTLPTNENSLRSSTTKLGGNTTGRIRSISNDPYNQEFVKTKNEWVHIYNNQQIPYHEGQFLSSKTQNFYPKNLNQSCEGWKEPDDIDRLPRSAYMYAYA